MDAGGAGPRIPRMLTERQKTILGAVVDGYVENGRPVGSRVVASRREIAWSPSTIRAELANLEESGYLTHPHTSAGRVPTDAGYRFYVEGLLASDKVLPAPAAGELRLDRMRREVEEAIRETTGALAHANDLVALV